MSKKAKVFGRLLLIYSAVLSFLIAFLLSYTIAGGTKLTLVIAVIFVFFAVIGYLFLVLYKLKNASFVCKKCNEKHKLKFFDYLFATRDRNGVYVKCNCSEEEQLTYLLFDDEQY